MQWLALIGAVAVLVVLGGCSSGRATDGRATSELSATSPNVSLVDLGSACASGVCPGGMRCLGASASSPGTCEFPCLEGMAGVPACPSGAFCVTHATGQRICRPGVDTETELDRPRWPDAPDRDLVQENPK